VKAQRALVLGATAALFLTACAPASREDWTPPSWPQSEVHTTDPVPEIDAGGSLAPALLPMRLRNDELGIQVRVTLLPEGPTTATFNAAVEQQLRGAIDGRVAASGMAYAPTASPAGAGLGDRRCTPESTRWSALDLLGDPALGPAGGTGTAVVCGIVLASGPFLGERLRVVAGGGGVVDADFTAIIYTDVLTGETVGADGLWADGAAEALSAGVVESVRRDAGALSHRPASAGDEGQIAAIRAALASTVPSAEGFVITLAPGFVAPDLAALGVPPTTEPISIAVPPNVASRLASPFGARVLATLAQPYAGPFRAPAGFRAVDCALVPCVALTYDDGPSGLTPAILDELAARDAAATFFAMGENARRHAGTLARMTREGHEVEGHTWNHPHLPRLTPREVSAQVQDSTRALEAASGQRITAFRPPYGEFTPEVLAAAGMPAILWDVDTLDWQGPSDEVLIVRAVDLPQPGSIVLLHDIHQRTERTAGAVLDGLLDRGFVLVTVRQLFGGELPASGAWRRAP
jgi:peptidoglycan/xylan/chitin deacetylase (PgdA/CDA1 family)